MRELPRAHQLLHLWNDLLDCCIRLLSGTALRIRPEHLPECARARYAKSGFTSHGEEIIVTGD
jgi:hypothetical protein